MRGRAGLQEWILSAGAQYLITRLYIMWRRRGETAGVIGHYRMLFQFTHVVAGRAR